MKIDNNINKVIAENLDIKRIVSGGGYSVGEKFFMETS